MARLPSDSDLGQMPGAGYQRPIAVVDNTPITKGIQDVGKGVSDLAGGINVAVKEVKRVGDATDEARATSNYLSGRVKRDAELADLTDEDAIEGHKKTYTDNLDVSAAMIRDPAKRELFRLRYQPNVEQANVAVDKHWEKIDTDRTLASTNESLDNIVKTAPKVSEELRSAALKTINTTIDGLVEAQKITAVQGQKLKKDWAEKYGEAAVGSLPPSQRIAALAMPGNLSGSETDRTMQILRAREGFRSTTYWDVNHHRVGYGSDTITMPDGSVRTVQQGDSVTQADAERDLARRSNDSLAQVRAAIGDEAYGKLSANARAALGSVTYNYGSVPGRVIEAAKSGDGAQLADAIERLQGDNNGVNRQRRLVEAAIARGGNVPGSSVAAIIPEDRRKDIINGANREMNLQSQQEQLAVANERATVKSMMADDEQSLLRTGKALPDLTPDRVSKALGPAATEEFLRARENAQKYHDATNDWDTLPSKDIGARVESLKPQGGTRGFAASQSYYDAAQKQASQIIKQRESDPASAVDKFPDVTAARSGIDANNPETVAALAKARMRAQEVIGIPESARMPVTKQEAAAIGKPIFNAPEGSDTITVIRQVLPFLDKAYGKDADKVLEYALTEAGLDAKVSKQAHNMMRKLQRGEPLTPSDSQALQTEQTNAAQKQAAGPGPFDGDMFAIPEKAPQQTRTIPAAAIAELRRNPQAIDAFIQKYGTDDYGRDAAKKAAEALGINVPKETNSSQKKSDKIDPDLPAEGASENSFFGRFFGSDPNPKVTTYDMGKREAAWPSSSEVDSARKHDRPYGDPSAPFFDYGIAKMRTVGTLPEMIQRFNNDMMKDVDAQRIDPETSDRLFTAWVAAQASPIAALGFDPRKMVTARRDVTQDKDLTLGGTYSPKSDTIATTGKYDSTFVHESIHRGFEMLRKAGRFPASAKGVDEELLTRAMISKYFGDVEKGRGKEGDKQVDAARWEVKYRPGFKTAIDDIEAAAAQYYADKRPGGPR